ncbi:MAG: IcmT/TraK family protein [Deltaproteobacteria bacterium]|jgi:intracellular multiplication protein IcmT|nr:IcmT/TraK family protein [Deltaproteobacteria bacterium]
MRDQNANWAFSALTPRFFFLDARAVFPLGLFLLRFSKFTLALALVSSLVFYLLERRRLPFNVAGLYLRLKLCGDYRPAVETSVLRARSSL